MDNSKYYIFIYDYYEPYGGWSDFHGCKTTVQECIEYISTKDQNYETMKCQIVFNDEVVITGVFDGDVWCYSADTRKVL